jgi:hypothetical protein
VTGRVECLNTSEGLVLYASDPDALRQAAPEQLERIRRGTKPGEPCVLWFPHEYEGALVTVRPLSRDPASELSRPPAWWLELVERKEQSHA